MQSRHPRSRARLAVASGAVIVAGLLGRQVPGMMGDVVGGLLYAVLLFLVLAVAVPSARTSALVTAAAARGVAIELSQLTGLPARLGDLWAPARLVLGSTFVPRDLAVAGAALGAATDLLTRRPAPGRRAR